MIEPVHSGHSLLDTSRHFDDGTACSIGSLLARHHNGHRKTAQIKLKMHPLSRLFRHLRWRHHLHHLSKPTPISSTALANTTWLWVTDYPVGLTCSKPQRDPHKLAPMVSSAAFAITFHASVYLRSWQVMADLNLSPTPLPQKLSLVAPFETHLPS